MATCKTEGCRKEVRRGCSRCDRCNYQRRKERDPVALSYQQLRQNARRRGKVFTITLEYFRAFAYEVTLMVGRGRTKNSFHVDRIKDELGYIPGNLQKLTCSENVKKENARRKKVLTYDYETKFGRYFDASPKPPDPDAPF